MGLIERERKQELVTVRVKLEASALQGLREYADYMQSSVDHVIAAAVDYIITRDKEFAKSRATGPGPRKGVKKLAEIA